VRLKCSASGAPHTQTREPRPKPDHATCRAVCVRASHASSRTTDTSHAACSVVHGRYRGLSGFHTWIGPSRFVVADLTAGPAQFGSTAHAEGGFTDRTLPRIRAYVGADGTIAQPHAVVAKAHIASLVVSAIQYGCR
jgi:hypothetical protein